MLFGLLFPVYVVKYEFSLCMRANLNDKPIHTYVNIKLLYSDKLSKIQMPLLLAITCYIEVVIT